VKNLHQIREISALSFNERVLQEAEDARNPLMERLRFLGIFSSNMDEFFKVRIASVQRRIELGNTSMNKVIEFAGHKARELDERFRAAYDEIVAGLAHEGVKLLTEHDINNKANGLASWLHDYFRDEVLPNLVPIMVDKTRPFPPLTDGALYFGVKMWGDPDRYAVLEVPGDLPRFVELPNGNLMYIDDVIRHSLNDVFYIFDYDRIEAFEFKISRDAELDVDNDFAEDYIRKMERELEQRKGGRPTRLVYDKAMPGDLLRLLRSELHITKDDTLIAGGRYHNMKDLIRLPNRRPDLAYIPIVPARHPVLDRARTPILDIIRKQDVLVTYPYQSFDHLMRLLREAAIDPKVQEIKMTLYRAARNSQVVNALVNAARNGKKIFVSIELQARFDEKNNIKIAERLSEAGATVVYGVPPMKVHSKLLSIHREGMVIAGLSTGNFNEITGRLYVDSTLLTADPRLTDEVEAVFELLARASRMRLLTWPKFEHLLVSPFNTRKAICRLIAQEKEKGEEGYIFMKVNHLTDAKTIRRIREAADAGVRMDLIVRTTFAMLPHPNIRAISILDRFLEHQRTYIFGRGKDRRIFLSSADLMERNLDWRVEVAFPIYDPGLQKLIVKMMDLQVHDKSKARILDTNQTNRYVSETPSGPTAQQLTQRYLESLGRRAERAEKTA